MEFQKLVEQVLEEDVVAGGEASAFGPNAHLPYEQNTKDDARTMHGLYGGGVMTRSGMRKKKKKSKNKKRK